jgi:hypothetical protein
MHPLMREIRHYFKFLFDRGYKIRESDIPQFPSRYWLVVFESAECLIEMRYDQGEVFLSFCPDMGGCQYRYDIRAMIFYLSKGKNIIRQQDEAFYKSRKKQLDWIAYLLNSYIDKIVPCFTHEFATHKTEILAASKEYFLIYSRRLE